MAIEQIGQKKKTETFMKQYRDDRDMNLVIVKDEKTGRVIRTEETTRMACDAGDKDKTIVNVGATTEFTYDEKGNLTQDKETTPFHSEETTRQRHKGLLIRKETQSHDNKEYYRKPYNFTKKITYYNSEGKPDRQVSFKLDENGKEIADSKIVKYDNPKNDEFED